MSLDGMFERLGHAAEELTAAGIEAEDPSDPVEDHEVLRQLDQTVRGLHRTMSLVVKVREQSVGW